MSKIPWQVKCPSHGGNWKVRITITLIGFVCVYFIFSFIYTYFITYSRSNLMGHQSRLCEKHCTSPIPRIIHHTWKEKNVPEKWQTTVQSCLTVHKDYEQRLWTDADMEAFIEKEYPWFLATYRKYPHEIERADSFRLFALYHFGGVYSDLDVGCNVPVHEIMQNISNYNVILAAARPTGVTTELMATSANHPLFELAISGLCNANGWYGLPYLDVMFSTGPMFLTRILSMYDGHDVYIMPYEEYKSLFWLTKGNSWHEWDAKFFITLFNVLPLELVAVLLCVTILTCAGFCSYRYWFRS